MTQETKSIFHDQADFMAAAGNVFPECRSLPNIDLGFKLIVEEYHELRSESASFRDLPGVNPNEVKEALDLIYVTAQYLNTIIGADKALECWNALQANNMSKCIDGKLVKREDGKVLKPEGYQKLDLSPLLTEV